MAITTDLQEKKIEKSEITKKLFVSLTILFKTPQRQVSTLRSCLLQESRCALG